MKVAAPILCVLVASAVSSNGQTTWAVDSLQRIGPSDAAGSGSSITIYAAKAESESFQVIVHAPSSGLTVNNVSVSNLTGPGGATISQPNIVFYREYYVDVTQPSPDFGVGNRPLGAGWYPDALIPFKDPNTGAPLSGQYTAIPYSVPGSQNAPFWVDVNVPRNATAGNYTGAVTVATSGGTSTIGVNLTVWNFTLPVAPRMLSTFGFHGGEGYLANNEVLLQHRVQPFTIVPSDLSTLQGYGAEIVGLPYFNESSGCTIEIPPTSTQIASSVAQYPAGFPTYVYPADEVNGCPNLAQNLQLWAQAAHYAGTKTLVTVVPDPTLLDDGTGTGRSDVDIWAILPKQYCANIQVLPCAITPAIPTVIAKGNMVWSYSEQEQDYYSPKWLIDFAPINYRIMPGFINQQFGFTGMLYSDVGHWSSDPWNNVQSWVAAGYTFPGDDMLVYPGQQVGLSSVVPSMRLKYIRDGVDDYDYMAMLKDQGQSSFVQQVLNSIVPDWMNWTKNTSTILSARIQLGQQLNSLNGGGGSTSPQPPANPWPASGSTGLATALTLQWSSVSGASQYQVYLGQNSSSLSLYGTVAASGGQFGNEAVYNLNAGTTYYWNVIAITSSGSVPGPVWSFSTAGGVSLQPPSNPWPASGATGLATSLTLQWSSVSGASTYQVHLGADPGNMPLYATIAAPGGSQVSAPVYNLNRTTRYFWYVVATSGASSASSAVWTFVTN